MKFNFLKGLFHMNRSLADILAIITALKAVYDPIAGKKLTTTTELIAVAGEVIAVLVTHKVTLEELQGLIGEIGPLVALFVK
jgi:hypothetical protein